MSDQSWTTYDLAGAGRRALDIIVALFGLTLFAIPALLIALAIRLETPGPALFSQMRLGYGGLQFRMYKFRKFGNAGGDSGRQVTLRGDPRMTRIGRLLEATKLDELPQLWNVLKGDMALVGPRPESLAFADCFIGPARELLRYRPGLFGPSQVIFRNEGHIYPTGCDPETFYRARLFATKAAIDLAYFPHRRLSSDIVWLARSILVLLGSSVFQARTEGEYIRIEKWVGQSWQPCPVSAFSPYRHATGGLADDCGQEGASQRTPLRVSPQRPDRTAPSQSLSQ